MEWVSAMVLASATEWALAMASLVMQLLTPLPMPLRSTLTRSPPTPTSMPWLTTTLDPFLTPRSPTMAPLPGRDTTLSTFPMEGSSTSTTTPTTSTDMLPRSLTMALLPSPLPLLVLVTESPTVVSSATVVWLILAKPIMEEKRPTYLCIYQ